MKKKPIIIKNKKKQEFDSLRQKIESLKDPVLKDILLEVAKLK